MRSALRRPFSAVLVVAIMVAAAACGDDSGSDDDGGGNGGGNGGDNGEPLSVGMALTGPRDDAGYNQGYYDGGLAAEEEYDIELSVQDNVGTPQEHLDSIENLAADNDVVIGVGAEFAEPALTLGPEFPDTTFLIVNGETSPEVDNVFAYFVRQGVPAYPMGAVAAELTETNKIGFIGGTEIPPTFASRDALEAGAQSIDPSIEVVATNTGDFYDAALSRDAARAQIDAGVDLIYALQNGAALDSVAQAIEESGRDVLLFNPVLLRCDEFPDLLVGTAVLSSTSQILAMLGDVIDDTLPSEPVFYGIEDPELQRFELCPDFATPELTDLVDEVQSGIVSGEIELPEDV